MSNPENTENAIESILVIPRNKLYAQFYLNGSPEGHTMRYQELAKYLAEIDTYNIVWISEYIRENRIFMLFPKDHQIVSMTPEDKTVEQFVKDQFEEMKRVAHQRNQKRKKSISEKADGLLSRLYNNTIFSKMSNPQ